MRKRVGAAGVSVLVGVVLLVPVAAAASSEGQQVGCCSLQMAHRLVQK